MACLCSSQNRLRPFDITGKQLSLFIHRFKRRFSQLKVSKIGDKFKRWLQSVSSRVFYVATLGSD